MQIKEESTQEAQNTQLTMKGVIYILQQLSFQQLWEHPPEK